MAPAKTLGEIAKICNSLNAVELVAPINESEEREKFKQNPEYNPTFKYDESKLKQAVSQLDHLKELEDEIGPYRNLHLATNDSYGPAEEILIHRVADARMTIDIANSILKGNDRETAVLVSSKYGSPCQCQTPFLSGNIAGELPWATKKFEELKEVKYGPKDIAKFFRKIIKIYGIEGWPVVLEDNCLAIDVRDKNSSGLSKVVIPKNRKPVSGLKLLELMGHEIECHLRGSVNSRAFWKSILKEEYAFLAPLLAKSDDEVFYEGVAKWSDVQVNGDKGLPSQNYTKAIGLAQQGKTFSFVANEIAKTKNPEHPDPEKDGWVVARRVFRGSVDPSNAEKYAFTKDRVYLDGLALANRLATVPPLWNFSSMSLRDIRSIGWSELIRFSASVKDEYLRFFPEILQII